MREPLTKKAIHAVLGASATIHGTKFARRASAPFTIATPEGWDKNEARIDPIESNLPPPTAIKITGAWRRVWASAMAHACDDFTRPYMSQICLDDGYLIATDGHRLCRLPVQGQGLAGKRMGLPRIAIHGIERIDYEESVAIWIADGRANFAIARSGWTVSAPAPAELYPSVERAIPQNPNYPAFVDCSRWSAALHRAPAESGIQIEPYVDSVLLSTHLDTGDPLVGLWSCRIKLAGRVFFLPGIDPTARIEGQRRELWRWGVNPNYLADAIDAIGSSEIRLLLGHPLDPYVIGMPKGYGVDQTGPVAVVMPMRL